MKYVVRQPNGELTAFSDGELIVYGIREEAEHGADMVSGMIEIYDPIIAHQHFATADGQSLLVEYNQAGCIYRTWVGGRPNGKGVRLPSFVISKEQFNQLVKK